MRRGITGLGNDQFSSTLIVPEYQRKQFNFLEKQRIYKKNYYIRNSQRHIGDATASTRSRTGS
jgi:hypothetical protein